VAIKVGETAWHLLGIALSMLHFQANLLFLYVSTPSGATGRYQCYRQVWLNTNSCI